MNCIILGPPCSGKSTICKLFNDNVSLLHLSTGMIMRKLKLDRKFINRKDKTDIITNQVNTIIRGLGKETSLFIEGPRRLNEVRDIEKVLTNNNREINIIFELQINMKYNETKNFLLQRMSDRIKRGDDKYIYNRIFLYYKNIKSIRNYYKKTIIKYVPLDATNNLVDILEIINHHTNYHYSSIKYLTYSVKKLISIIGNTKEKKINLTMTSHLKPNNNKKVSTFYYNRNNYKTTRNHRNQYIYKIKYDPYI
jgi:adenylate kinase family enzyme